MEQEPLILDDLSSVNAELISKFNTFKKQNQQLLSVYISDLKEIIRLIKEKKFTRAKAKSNGLKELKPDLYSMHTDYQKLHQFTSEIKLILQKVNSLIFKSQCNVQ
ncbi:hypothetical protein RF11_12985 [Thelohanellus kitauei]|uniref:Uncharacterized protein n=1 Tax=Thelohanellus kitauei TaxID=669202 RepID=A0A0C2JXE6_THEKT|nr:hypothetical protein RF11_12985 [Thelohanellus kitauei]